MERNITTIVSDLSFTECPRRHAGRLWFSDFYTHQVFSTKGDGSDLKAELSVPAQPSGLGWLPDGRLLVVSMRDRKVMRREGSGDLVVHADLAAHVTAAMLDWDDYDAKPDRACGSLRAACPILGTM